jgi:hypothetical protein
MGARIVRSLLESGLLAAVYLIINNLECYELVALWLTMPDLHLLEWQTLKEIKSFFWRFKEPIKGFHDDDDEIHWFWNNSDYWEPYASRLKSPLMTPSLLLSDRKFLENTYNRKACFVDHFNFHVGTRSNIAFNQVYNLIVLHSRSSLALSGITRVESYCSKKTLPKVIYKVLHECTCSDVLLSWSPDGLHLLIGETRLSKKNVQLLIFRYFPEIGIMRMVSQFTELANDRFVCASHLVSPFLWINPNTFLLPKSSCTFMTVELSETRTICSLPQILIRSQISGENGCFIALPEINGLVYLEACEKSKLKVF